MHTTHTQSCIINTRKNHPHINHLNYADYYRNVSGVSQSSKSKVDIRVAPSQQAPPPSLCSHFIVLVNVIVSLTEADFGLI